MKRSRSFLSFVQALAPNPNRLSFAIRNRVIRVFSPEHARHRTE